MTPESPGALLANEIRNCLAAEIADETKPAPINVVRERILDRAIRERSKLWLPKKYAGYKEFLSACDTSVRQTLGSAGRLGPDASKWIWGNVFQARFQHPLAAVPFIGGQFVIPRIGIPGSGQTPNVGASVSMRFIASPGNWDATRLVVPLGQSGDPASVHFKDQFTPWLDGTPQVFVFSREAVAKAAVKITRFSPK
jgi:penicillin amidase